jgi:streptogramin lyase
VAILVTGFLLFGLFAAVTLTAPAEPTSEADDLIDLDGAPVALAADDGGLWVAMGDGGLVRIDAASLRSKPVAGVGFSPEALAVGSGSIWAATDAGVYRLDGDTGAVKAIIPIGGGSSETLDWEIVAVDDAVWVMDVGGPTITRIDPSSNTMIAQVRWRDGPVGLKC